MKKINLKELLTLILIPVFILSFVPFLSSCTPELAFEELTVCWNIKEDTFEPIDPEDEFGIGVEKIYATIKYFGVSGEDNYRYKWIYMDTGEVILDKTLNYSEDRRGYFEGYAMSYISTSDEIKVIPPGSYKIEFYHNGELKSTKEFVIKKPDVKISEVALADEVDENYAPLNTTQEFKSNDIIYACVNVDYYFSGNRLKAKWYDVNGNLIIETVDDFKADLYEPMWTAFTFEGENRDLPAGAYRVEIYLNDILYGSYDFEVGDARSAEAGEDIFTQGNLYSNEKYSASFAVPDNWIYTESENADGLTVNLNTQSGDLPVAFVFMASPIGDYPPADQYKTVAEEICSGASGEQNWELIEVQENESVTKKGTKYQDFIYLYKDPDNTEWAMVVSFTEAGERLYMLFGTVMDSYFEMGEAVYLGIMESLEL
jgi:hypothetical protein